MQLPLKKIEDIIRTWKGKYYIHCYPTKNSCRSGKVKSVVNLLDQSVMENNHWIDKEKKELQKTNVQFKQISLKENASDKQMETVVRSVIHLPRPLVIHSWSTKFPDNIRFRKIFARILNKSPINLATDVPETY